MSDHGTRSLDLVGKREVLRIDMQVGQGVSQKVAEGIIANASRKTYSVPTPEQAGRTRRYVCGSATRSAPVEAADTARRHKVN